MTGVPVRIRHVDDADSVPLGTFDPASLEDLVDTVKKWGCYVTGNDTIDLTDAFGQFVIGETEGFFEVVVEERAHT